LQSGGGRHDHLKVSAITDEAVQHAVQVYVEDNVVAAAELEEFVTNVRACESLFKRMELDGAETEDTSNPRSMYLAGVKAPKVFTDEQQQAAFKGIKEKVKNTSDLAIKLKQMGDEQYSKVMERMKASAKAHITFVVELVNTGGGYTSYTNYALGGEEKVAAGSVKMASGHAKHSAEAPQNGERITLVYFAELNKDGISGITLANAFLNW
jgi:hypothetical protein